MEKRTREELLAILWSEIIEKNNTSFDSIREAINASFMGSASDDRGQGRHGRCLGAPFNKNENDSLLLEDLISEKLLKVGADGNLSFTDEGYNRAKKIVRLHRLTERLLHDVLGISGGEMHISACEFEHIISPSVEESICALLGHPRLCPHGSKIPEGDCCLKKTEDVKPIIVPLGNLPPGKEARVAYIYTPDHSLLHKLLSMGFMPGAVVKLHQKYPSLVVNIGSTMVALEEDVAKTIFVRR